jgi:8-oxo-dGTP pyrophosphatase MutT (NUDIX family)
MKADTKIDNSWFVKPDGIETRKAAGGIVARRENKQIKIALIRDTKFHDYMIPKGGIENTESVKQAAEREIEEETGLNKLKYLTYLGQKGRLTFDKSFWAVIDYFLFSTEQMEGNQKLQDGEEDLILEWFDLDDIPSFFWPEQKQLIEENKEKILSYFNLKS